MKTQSSKPWQYIQVVTICIVIFVSFTLAIVGPLLTGVTVEVALWLLVGLVGTLGTYLLASNLLLERRIDRLESSPSSSTIVSQKEWYERLISYIRSARTSIDITHHEPRTPMISGIKPKKELFEALGKKIKNSDVLVRWIIAINSPEKLEWASNLLEEYKRCDNFSLRYSLVELDYCCPPQSVQTIDSSVAFVIDMAKGHHSASELDLDLFTEDPKVVEQMCRYYNRYWDSCGILKEGSNVYTEDLAKLRSRFERGESSV